MLSDRLAPAPSVAPPLAVLRRARGRLAPARSFTSGRSAAISVRVGAGILPVRRLALGTLVAVTVACGDDGDGGGGRAGAEDLEERVVALLEAEGQAVDGDLEGAEVVCPAARDPQPGDRLTCEVRFDDGRDVEVDIEFEEGGAITVVGVIPG